MAATSSLTWLAASAQLSPYQRSRIELFAHAGALTPESQVVLERLALDFVRLMLLEQASATRERDMRRMMEDEMAVLLEQFITDTYDLPAVAK